MHHELLIISAYRDQINDIRHLCAEMGISPPILEWERATRQLIDILNALFSRTSRPDVIISRGAVADLIERHFPDIVVLRAEPDDMDLAEALAKAKIHGPRLGFLLYAADAADFKTGALREMLGLAELRIYPYRSRRDIERLIVRGAREGLDAMAGGGRLGARTGAAMGFPVVFVPTGRRSVRSAIIRALAIIEARRVEKRQLRSLESVMASVNEGLLLLRGGRISLANQAFADLLGLAPAPALERLSGRDMASLPGLDAGLRRFLREGGPAEAVLRIRGQAFLFRKVPLSSAGAAAAPAAPAKETRAAPQGIPPVRPVPPAPSVPPPEDECLVIARDVTEIQQQERRIRRELHDKGLAARHRFEDLAGESAAFKSRVERARLFAATDANILIHGESGTGKELFAQSIHNASARKNRPFVAVNCAAIPESLLESELFGYEEGAFTGARRGGKAGLFELAHGGTVFLDEINSLPVPLQGVLLRVIQEKEIRRVGAQAVTAVDVRVISAANADMAALLARKEFRPDLFHRLNTLNLTLPPLSEREGDALLLARRFLQAYGRRYKTAPPALSPSDRALIRHTRWSGNVRELENVIHRYVVLSAQAGGGHGLAECLDGGAAVPSQPGGASAPAYPDAYPEAHTDAYPAAYTDGPPVPRPDASPETALLLRRGTLAAIEEEVIARYLEECRWNKEEAAAKLGICRATLWRKLKKSG